MDDQRQQDDEQRKVPRTVLVPIDRPHFLTHRHYEYEEMPAGEGVQDWDARLWHGGQP